MKLIQRGAEANLYKNKSVLIKDRVRKGYRIKELDEKIRKSRTKAESKLLNEAGTIIKVPRVVKKGAFKIEMEFIDGKRIKEILNKNNMQRLCKKIGSSVGKLHKLGIIHGDLTTSNMLLKNDKIYFIDFGLGFYSKKIEDQATDLHLLEEAFNSTHYQIAASCFSRVLKEYIKHYEKADEVLKRLEDIRKRGRYIKR